MKGDLPARLHAIHLGLREAIRANAPDAVAIEEAFYGKSVQSALRIGEERQQRAGFVVGQGRNPCPIQADLKCA